MLNELLIDITLAVFSSITAILFVIMYKERTYPKSWIGIAITNIMASIFFAYRHSNPDFRIIGNIFYFLTAIILGISIAQEYYRKFFSKEEIHYWKIIFFIIILFLLPIILLILHRVSLINLIQFSLMSFLILVAYIMVILYKNEKSITHIFMIITIIFSFLTLLFSIFHNLEIEGAWEVAYIVKIIFYAALLFTGLSAPIEDILNESEKKFKASYYRAEFYKDLFVHDINNILQIILSADQMLQLRSLDNQLNQQEHYIKLIENQVHRGSKLVKNLRKLSELSERKIHSRKLDIVLKLRETIEELKKIYHDKRINFNLETHSNQIYVRANELIVDVFENIFTNSIEHNINPEIEVAIRTRQIKEDQLNYIRIEIIDNAKGIEDTRKNSIFFRAFDIGSKLKKGLGLGLSLVYKIIEVFDGKIWVEDRIKGDYSKGSRFIILIPEVY